MTWSTSFGASVGNIDGVFADLTVWNAGQITVTATITNSCDNSSGSISKTITAH